MSVTPREIVTFPPGQEVNFSLSNYPWCVAVRVHLKGGNAAVGGSPGRDGYVIVELYDQDPRGEEG